MGRGTPWPAKGAGGQTLNKTLRVKFLALTLLVIPFKNNKLDQSLYCNSYNLHNTEKQKLQY